MTLMQTFQAPYTYHEYPKWVRNQEGVDVIVKNEDEEAQATGVMSKIERDSDEDRQMLLAQAKELGLRIHPSIKTENLREKVAAHKE